MTKSGEPGEVVRLLIEERTSLFTFILAIVRDYYAAEDVLQEVSVAVCESSDQFQPGTNFGAWAREIARRRMLASRRAALRFPAALTDDNLPRLEAAFEQVDSQVSTKQRIGALRRCLEMLLHPDVHDQGRIELHGSAVCRYDSYYISLLWISNYTSSVPTRYSGQGMDHMQLAYSYNGLNFTRGLRQPLVPNQQPGQPDFGSIWARGMIVKDDEILIYWMPKTAKRLGSVPVTRKVP